MGDFLNYFIFIVFFVESYAQIAFDNGSGIVCDGIQCPKGAKVCFVKKDSIPNTDRMTVERSCKSGDGKNLFSDVQTVASTSNDYHFVSETSIDGSYSLNSNTMQISQSVRTDIQKELTERSKKLENDARIISRHVQDSVKKALDGLFNRRGLRFF